MFDNDFRFPWPSKEDRLFLKTASSRKKQKQSPLIGSMLETLLPDVDYLYREGYYEAGEIIARQLSKGGHDDLAYPMLYCFRHYLELSIKALIRTYAELMDVEPTVDVYKEHSLLRLWNEADRLVRAASPEQGEEHDTLKLVGQRVHEFNAVDKDSQLFRYATDNTGDSAGRHLPQVDLIQFLDAMRNLHSFFNGCKDQGEHWIECKREMEEYYRDDYEYGA